MKFSKKVSLQNCITRLEAATDKLHFGAEEEQNWTLATESDLLEKTANEKESCF